MGTHPLLVRQDSFCHPDEVCINGLGPGSAAFQGRQWATCVKKSFFNDETMYGPGSQTISDIQTLVDDHASTAYMVMSDADSLTPREVKTYDLTSWIDDYIDPDGNIKHNKCRECVDLKTDRFAAHTKALRAEATLLTAGAATGILWLGFLSG